MRIFTGYAQKPCPLPEGRREAMRRSPVALCGRAAPVSGAGTGIGRAGAFLLAGQIQKEVPRMAKAGNRVKITLRCSECKQRNYNTKKNKRNTTERLELNKYCPFCRKHTKHTETK